MSEMGSDTTVEEWQKRIFTDEIHVELSPHGELYAKIIHVIEIKILLGAGPNFQAVL